MSKQAHSMFGMPFENFFPALEDFIYYPTTVWEGMFKNFFSPTINFGKNVEDIPVEKHVLEKVGSYGKQLNCVFDTMSILVSRIEKRDLTPDEQYAIFRFKDLAARADAAASNFKGQQPQKRLSARMADVDDWLAALLKLKLDNEQAYANLVSHLERGIADASRGGAEKDH
jgi:hypothetical protein